MTKEKKIWLGLTMLVVLAIGVTFAWWAWTSTTDQNTNVSLTIDGMTINYEDGDDIVGANLIPVSTKEQGVADGTAIEKTITVSAPMTTYLNLYMTLETFPEELQHETFLYELYKGSELVTGGNFASSKQGDRIQLLKRQEVNLTESVFSLYIWIDGDLKDSEDQIISNPTTMMNQNFKFVLNADGTTDPNEFDLNTAAGYIMSKNSGDSWEANSNGLYKTTYTTETREEMAEDYRYVGVEVNNYVRFNNDMYQIIGVFDENTHGKEGKKLVKLIASNLFTSTTFGAYNDAVKDGVYFDSSNNWTGLNQTTPANTNILLNQYYFNKTSISDTYGLCSNWTYRFNYNDYKTGDCTTLVGYGIDENLKNYIETTTWYLNGYTSNGLTKENFYLCERGLYTGCGPAADADTTTEAKIGLMYVSDYMYATGHYGSTDTTQVNLNYYGIQNWLYRGIEWTITPRYNSTSDVFQVNYVGNITSTNSYLNSGVRPTFYLKSNVKITGGEGTFENPYTIGM